ncbi:MAG: hypothetical protein NZ893_03065, partial [Candidatus Aenigmarchaeota archaeon]|nr:hypothetical protein [Candidatus Aenigmarchaeota archaeon]
TKLLEALIFIDSSSQPSRLYEASMLREKEIDVFDIYKGLMKLFWQGKISVLESGDNVKVEFIKNSFKEWKKAKQEFLKIFKIFEKEWSYVVFKKDEHVAYHG